MDLSRACLRVVIGPLVIVLPLTIAVGCGMQIDGPQRSSTATNVILVSLDTLRADHLGCYGYRRSTSPILDRFAAEDAILFEDVVNTGGGTLPVHTSMFTSLPPTVHDVWPHNDRSLAPERITLAEQLRDAGYTTAAYTGAGFMVAKFGLDQGFELYDDEGGDFLKIMPKAYRWVETSAQDKFFLFLHTYDVHSDWKQLPYDAPDGFNDLFTADFRGDFTGCMFDECASELLALLNRKTQSGDIDPAELFDATTLDYMVGLYDGGIAYVDRELGRFFDHLRSLGLYDSSLIMITSDHGEEFLEHGLFLHHQNYEEVARVPLLVKLPHSRGGGRRVGGQVSTLEVMPTILDILGIEPNPEVQGRSLTRLVGGSWDGHQEVFMGGGMVKLRTPRWSLLLAPQGMRQLYDRNTDPGETVNQLRRFPEVAERLTASLLQSRDRHHQLRDELAEGALSADPDLSREEIERLRALGYLE